VLDLTWKLFSETGNIETYLLMKELEDSTDSDHCLQQLALEESISAHSKM